MLKNCSKHSDYYEWSVLGSQGQVSTFNSSTKEDVWVEFGTVGLSSVKLVAHSEDRTQEDVIILYFDVVP